MNVLEKLIFYWNYPFVRYALIVGARPLRYPENAASGRACFRA